MKNLIENKLLGLQEQMKAMETENLYYLKDGWKVLQAQQSILQELLSEERVERAVHLQIRANKEIDAFGQANSKTIAELTAICDNLTVIEANAFTRLMEESRK